MMRWSYLIPRLLILSLAWAFFAFAFDPLVRKAVIASGEQVAQAQIELSELKTGFFPPELKLRGVRVASRFEPGANLIEFDSLTLQLAGEPLLQKAFVVEHGSVTGLRWITPRRDSGEIGPGPDWLNPAAGKAAGLRDAAFDQLLLLAQRELDPRTFETVRRAEELEAQWRRRFDNFEQRSRDVKARVGHIQETVENIEGNTFDRIQAYRQAALQVNELLREVQAIREELPALGRIAQSDLRSLDEARQRDLAAIEQKLRIVQLDADAMTEWLVGRELADRLTHVVEWIQWIRGQLAVAEEIQDPERMRGADILFPSHNAWPKYLLKTLDVTGRAAFGGEMFTFAGQIRDVTTEPQQYGKPAVIQLDGHGEEAHWSLELVLDRTAPVPVDELAFVYRTVSPWETILGDRDQFALAVSGRQMAWEGRLRLEGDRLDGRVALHQAPVKLIPQIADETDERVAKAVANVLATIDHIDAELRVSGPREQLQWNVASNLGPELAAGLKQFVSLELARQRQRIAQQIDSAARDQTADLKRLLNERYAALLADLNGNETRARALVERFAGGSSPLRNLRGILRR